MHCTLYTSPTTLHFTRNVKEALIDAIKLNVAGVYSKTLQFIVVQCCEVHTTDKNNTVDFTMAIDKIGDYLHLI